MPDCIGDEKILKNTREDNCRQIKQTNEKIVLAVGKMKEGNPPKEGLNLLYHIAGLFGQRLWFYGKTATYNKKPNVSIEKCISCGRCVTLCPMKNIVVDNGKAVSSAKFSR